MSRSPRFGPIPRRKIALHWPVSFAPAKPRLSEQRTQLASEVQAARRAITPNQMFQLGSRWLNGMPVSQLSLPAGHWAVVGLSLAIALGLGRVEPRAAGLGAALAGFALLSAWLWTSVLEAPDRAILGGLLRRLRPAQG